jgi:CRP/FNR family transcriptional regulator, cyclic AMP receptor protein
MTESHSSTLQRMRAARFLDELSDEDLAKVAGLATMEERNAGTILFREGAVSDRLFLIARGRVALDMHVPVRGQVRILTMGPSELLGWSALLTDQRMTATATIVEAATFISIPGQKLQDLCDADRDVGYAVMRRMAVALAHRLLATRLQLLDLFMETQPMESFPGLPMQNHQ